MGTRGNPGERPRSTSGRLAGVIVQRSPSVVAVTLSFAGPLSLPWLRLWASVHQITRGWHRNQGQPLRRERAQMSLLGSGGGVCPAVVQLTTAVEIFSLRLAKFESPILL